MRIVILGPAHPYRGGIAHHTSLLAQHLAERHSVLLLTYLRQYPDALYPGQSDLDPSADPTGLPAERVLAPLQPWSWWRAARRIAAHRPDLVILPWWVTFWAPSLGTIRRLVRGRTGARTLFICHNVLPHESGGWLTRSIHRRLARYALGGAEAFIVHAASDEVRLRELLPELAEREGRGEASLSRALLPSHQIAERISREAARAALGLADDLPLMLFFGFVRRYKGLDLLIEALPVILERLPSMRLVIAGEFWEPAEGYLERAEELGVQASIQVEDRYIPNEEVAVFLAAADLLVMPYRSATQSGIVTLASQFGLPIVATDVGGLPEAVIDGQSGLIVPPEDAQALAGAIGLFFEEEGLAERLRAGVVEGRARFDWEPLVRLIELIGRESD